MAAEPKPDADIRRRWRYLMIGVLAAALTGRVVAAFAVQKHVENSGRQFLVEGDANGYWELGEKVAKGQPYQIHVPPRKVLRTPGFPIFLAACMHMAGTDVIHARLCLAVVGTACCLLVWVLGAQLSMQRVGFWAAVIVAFNPLQIGSSVLILSETLFTFLMLATLVCQFSLVQEFNRSTGKTETQTRLNLLLPAGCLGFLLAATTLVRPGFLLWVPVCCGTLVWLSSRSRPGGSDETAIDILRGRRIVALCTTLLAFFVTMLPWVWRNAEVTGHVVFTSLWSGPSMYDGLSEEADGTSNMQFFDREQVMSRQKMTEYEMNEHYKQRAIEFAVENPGRAIELAFLKAARYLAPAPSMLEGMHGGIRAGCTAFYMVFAGLVVIGFARGDGNQKLNLLELTVSLGPFLLFLLVHLVFVGSVRYRLPVEFPLAVLAGAGVRQLLTRNQSPPGMAATE